MSNKLDPKDLAYVQNLIRLNAVEISHEWYVSEK